MQKERKKLRKVLLSQKEPGFVDVGNSQSVQTAKGAKINNNKAHSQESLFLRYCKVCDWTVFRWCFERVSIVYVFSYTESSLKR